MIFIVLLMIIFSYPIFYPCPVVIDGITYQSSEAAYHALKYKGEKWRRAFAAMTPGMSKKFNRDNPVEITDEQREKIMTRVICAKFFGNSELLNKLLDTGDKYLEEGNNHGDIFWGTVNGVGDNRLGQSLMVLRDIARYGLIDETAELR